MPELQCPTCGRRFQEQDSSSLPFCSERCRMIDLGRWLDERNTVPHVSLPDLEEDLPEG